MAPCKQNSPAVSNSRWFAKADRTMFDVAQDKLAGKFLLRQELWIED